MFITIVNKLIEFYNIILKIYDKKNNARHCDTHLKVLVSGWVRLSLQLGHSEKGGGLEGQGLIVDEHVAAEAKDV